ncbi:hypothetical protein D9613_011119 [Agrocybe pediades]|uniref:Uncharacterized protein n=1 Tax=Agrocybe pediades TaxID=84607 RepID=A0A8H4QKP3_9AGAR|nr:hypothetical protein D9613_011119 [Agrocybe pediades]
MTGFTIFNKSNKAFFVFVSKYSGGDDSWFTLQPGTSDVWTRNGWEVIVFRDPDTGARRGWYLDCAALNTLNVAFFGLTSDVQTARG